MFVGLLIFNKAASSLADGTGGAPAKHAGHTVSHARSCLIVATEWLQTTIEMPCGEAAQHKDRAETGRTYRKFERTVELP